MEREEKLRALEAAMSQVERQFGKGAVMKLGDPSSKLNVETIPTGSLSLDIALGLGGIPKGRVIEIYGPESSGKTTVTLHMIAEVQKRGGIAGFIDAEHALDPVYAAAIGVDVEIQLYQILILYRIYLQFLFHHFLFLIILSLFLHQTLDFHTIFCIPQNNFS